MFSSALYYVQIIHLPATNEHMQEEQTVMLLQQAVSIYKRKYLPLAWTFVWTPIQVLTVSSSAQRFRVPNRCLHSVPVDEIELQVPSVPYLLRFLC